MIARSYGFLNVNLRSIAALAGVMVASCASENPSAQQVTAGNPSVTYVVRSDEELVQAKQSATNFCSQYRSTPGPAKFANDPAGNRVVVFECAPTPPEPAAPQFQHFFNRRIDRNP